MVTTRSVSVTEAVTWQSTHNTENDMGSVHWQYGNMILWRYRPPTTAEAMNDSSDRQSGKTPLLAMHTYIRINSADINSEKDIVTPISIDLICKVNGNVVCNVSVTGHVDLYHAAQSATIIGTLCDI